MTYEVESRLDRKSQVYTWERRRKHVFYAIFCTWGLLLVIGGAILVAAHFGYPEWQQFALDRGLIVFGLPLAGLMAFILVAMYCDGVDGDLTFEMFSLKFSGPAGPVLLWCVSFLSIAFATWLLRSTA
jgi:hypothetical protein